jgi:HSP20 family molecular chaperone IbpA
MQKLNNQPEQPMLPILQNEGFLFDTVFDYISGLNATRVGDKSLELVVPGYKIDKVELDGRVLRVGGKLESALKDSGRKATFEWSTKLWFTPNPDAVTAESASGVLLIHLEGFETQKKPKQVQVKIS